MSKFIWIMKTLGCNLSVDAFARFYELVIVPDVIKVSDGQFYQAQHACCTFNTRRQNTRKGITRIQIAPCCKTNLTDVWNSYWFYLKVNMSEVSGYAGPAHPLSCPIAPLTAVNTAEFNHRQWGLGTARVLFISPALYLGATTSLKSSLLPGFGRFPVVGVPSRSCISTSTGQLEKCLSRSSGLSYVKIKVLMPS
jgi:hypothetical protein